MESNYQELLRFSRPELSVGVNRMFEELKSKKGAKEFSVNPTGFISRSFPEVIGPINLDKISEANRLIFSIISNDSFRKWAIKYSSEIKVDFSLESTKLFDKKKFRSDIAEAIIKHGDKDIVSGLLGTQTRSEGLTTMDMQSKMDLIAVETFIIAVGVVLIFVVITAIDATPKVAPTGPDLSTLGNPADIRAIADQLVEAAKQFRQNQL